MAIDSTGTALQTSGGLDPTTPLATSATQTTSPTAPVISPDLASNVKVPPAINPTTLSQGQQQPILPSANTPDTTFINSLQTGNPASGLPSAQSLQQQQTTAQSNVDQTTSQIQNLIQELGMKGQDTTNLQNQANISGLQGNLADLNTKYAQSQAQYQQQFQRIGAQNIPSLFSSGQLALAKAAANSDLGSQAAQIQAAQGNLNTAFSTIDKTISEKYQPIQDNIDAQLKYLAANQTQLTAAQNRLAQRQSDILNAQKQQVQNQQGQISQAQRDLQTQITSGQIDSSAGFQAMADLLNGKISIGDFYAAINAQNPETSSGGINPVVSNTLQLIGTSDMPVSQAISTVGINKIVAGLIAQEGGSPQGVENNPGNIKYVGQAGATDSGVKATDGGTFASFKTPQAGQDAVAKLVQKAADKGQNLSDFIAAYKGVQNNAPDYAQYGLLANIPGFNPNNIQTKDAVNYLNYYIKNGAYPTSYALFGKTTGKNLSAVASKAQDLYFQATGQALPDVSILKGNKDLVVANNKLENNLNIQEGTVGKNFALAISNIDKNGINQSAQPINAFINNIKNLMGDPAVAQYLTQNGTLQNEVGSLIAIKNASGTTVADKLASAGLIPQNASEKQQKAVLKTLLAEAQNGFDTIKQVSGDLYKQIDPLQTDPNNPNRQQTSSSVSKGSLSDSDFVEKALSTNNVNYQDFTSQVPSGQKAVIDNATGQPGYIPVEEFDKSKYTPA